jgi:tetratricopeptide (TPR) repeat protein
MGDYHQAREYVEQGLRIAREVGNPYYETYALINLSAFTGILGEPEIAHRYAEGALELASKLGDRSAEAWAHTYLGHSLLALAHLADAQRAYHAALDIRRELNQAALAIEPASGLAQALLAGGDVASALESLAEPLDRIEAGDLLDGCDEPIRVFSVCYAVLYAYGDQPRARLILQKAYQFLQSRAERIPDGPARQAYLNNNPHHRLILDAYGG